jgi:hypothetical protein
MGGDDIFNSLRDLAGSRGVGMEDLRRQLVKPATESELSRECLSFDEAVDVTSLSQARLRHLDACTDCQALVEALRPSSRAVEAFQDQVTKRPARESQRRPGARGRRRPTAVAIGVGVAAALAFGAGGFWAGRSVERRAEREWTFISSPAQSDARSFRVTTPQEFSRTLQGLNEERRVRVVRQLEELGLGTARVEASLERVKNGDASPEVRREAEAALERVRATDMSTGVQTVVVPVSSRRREPAAKDKPAN